MAFWAVFSIGFSVALGFFVWSVHNYMASRRLRSTPVEPKQRVAASLDMNPVLIALEAQYLVAPSLALVEARDLARRLGEGGSVARMKRGPRSRDFQAIIARLSEWDIARIRA